MPQRPLIRVTFLDFYDMAEGPTYLETKIAVLGMNGTQPGWVVLTLPVTSGPACIGGRELFGLTKLLKGRVLRFGGSGTSFSELAARGDYEIKLGTARLEFAPDSLLQRLGVGAPLAAHCSRVRARYSIKAL
jgi:hypothetical protein